ncbi:sugar ABC transporter permease [Nitratireductor aquimarinus]|uniref:carbohydrate ABC transporter permease n=1 Tax=Alphaproteobacteria TaxID=28211 RepID=UPI0019D3FE42|nr:MULTISPECIES: sugar ABC transporter permease [Alphaproteobacteria]MBY6024666.1 sugar ABC transporter permease [Nitratireductor sp. DP7N14-4]MBN7759415.1 sugar ABC transporter permease [Nitratireductor aquimarinus]MBN7760571.1 sugar ABC transporter permease [Nitratireductor aquibiodomus]MBY6002210.1 sugar ABC transporter permease [Tritonibacter mobilis]MDJ1465851.1 sugar ABC transporter permease [Nitratireductor sp. GZWM139]
MRLSIERRQALTDLWLVGPATLALFLFIFLPVAIVAVLSFTDYQFGAASFNWSGLDNYIKLFSSSIGRRAVTNTLIYVAIVIPFSVGFGLLVAAGLHQMSNWAPRLSNVLKTVYFLPVAATLVAMSVAWQMVLHPSLGIVNQTLFSMGLPTPNWLSDRGLVLYTLSMIGIWQSVGYNMVLFLAGLAAIPSELYDAAEVDGAGSGWSRFWTVTWPMLGPTTLFVMVVTATNAFRVFETVATMTKGGPAFASDTLVYALYREGFVYFKAGYASAITMVFFAFLLALALIQFRFVEKRVHYR